MSDLPKRSEAAFVKYDIMSEEELRQILRQDALTPEGAGLDTEELFYVMEVLAKRKNEAGKGKSPEEALETFWNKYAAEAYDSKEDTAEAAPKRKTVRSRWIRSIAVAAAVLVIVIGSSVTARAFGFDFWDIVVKWTQETFHFGYAGDTTEPDGPDKVDEFPLSGLQTSLDQFGIEIRLVPQWIPDGYEEVEFQIVDTPKQRQFYAKYCFEDKELLITIKDHLGNDLVHSEQSDSTFETYQADGIDYYIFNNNGYIHIIWLHGSFEGFVSGQMTIEEAKKMIDSI